MMKFFGTAIFQCPPWLTASYCSNLDFPNIDLVKICSVRCQSQKRGQDLPQTSKMESFTIITNGFWPLTIVAKFSILDVYMDPGYTFEIVFF